MDYLLLILGFILLIKGADYFVDGAASVAYKFNISTTIVGLTIVALGTSLPEAAVSINASLAGSNSLAISNVVGSNIFNILAVVGCSCLIAPFAVSKKVADRDLGFNIFVTVLLLGMMLITKGITRIDGIIFLILLAGYIIVLIKAAKNSGEASSGEDDEKKILPNWKAVLYIVCGALIIMFGGKFTVDSAKAIAASLGMSETLIGLTVVSLGTSLPELVTSIVAARKGESGLSIGNAVGSCILNILFILGLSGLIHPLSVIAENIYDCMVLIAVAVFAYLIARFKKGFNRPVGLIMIACYIAYVAYIIIR